MRGFEPPTLAGHAPQALIERNGKVLILNDPERGLDFPGGKVQVGEEDLKKSLHREIKEETTLEVKILNPIDVGFWNKTRPTYFVFFKAQYLNGEVKLSNEHDKFEWLGKESLSSLDSGHNFYSILKNYFEGS